MKKLGFVLAFSVGVLLIAGVSTSGNVQTHTAYAQSATPTACPDGQSCEGYKRYAFRTQLEDGDDRIYGIYANGTYSDPCVLTPRTNYSLWVVDNSQTPYEFLEIGIKKDETDGELTWFTGCTICEEGHFWGPDPDHPIGGNFENDEMSFRIEKIPAAGHTAEDCWLWFVNGDEVRNTCDETLEPGDSMDSATHALAGGETDDYRNDMGVHYWTHMAVKLTDSTLPMFENFAPDDGSPQWIYTSNSRYASDFTSGLYGYDPSLMVLSDTHFANIWPDFCNGR